MDALIFGPPEPDPDPSFFGGSLSLDTPHTYKYIHTIFFIFFGGGMPAGDWEWQSAKTQLRLCC